jgi:F-type H+-transporting ATPase subunit delta
VRSSTVVRRYARALFSLAVETNAVAAVREELARIAELFEAHPELERTLFQPLHPVMERRAVLQTVCRLIGSSTNVRNFLLFLVDQRRLVDYEAIRGEFDRLADESAGRMQAEVVAAVPLDDRQTERLRAALSARTGLEIELEVRVDPELIGGVIAAVGGLVFDGSLRTQLSQLRDTLTRGH